MLTQKGYHSTDSHLVDYEMYRLPGVERGFFRGPPVRNAQYLACVGAAQTFGRFVATPFPRLLSQALGIDVLNLGRGGSGPTYPLSQPALLEHINRARLVVVQVLSGRSQSNSAFQLADHGVVGVNTVTGAQMDADGFYSWLLGQDRDYARGILMETRERYVTAMSELLTAIEPPKILLWISTRRPDYEERWELPLARFYGAFPQFVNRAMVEQLRGRAHAYVECVSSRGSPQRIVDRQGNPSSFRVPLSGQEGFVEKTMNAYYPSPEMHEDAARLLLPACRQFLSP